MKNHNLLIVLSSMALSIAISGGLLYFYQTKNVSAEEIDCPRYYKLVEGDCVKMSPSEICPAPHTHQSGDYCVCDDGYKIENNVCVPMTDVDLCPGEHEHLEGDECWCDEGYGRLHGEGDCVLKATACPANSHLVGEQCICDDKYKAENGVCVKMTDAELCPNEHEHLEGDECWCDEGYGRLNGVGDCVPKGSGCPANSHWTGDYCTCDDNYKAKNGACVEATAFEICGVENAHPEGDKCVCDEGYGAVNGKCVLKETYCTNHHAHYNKAIDDCDCNEGYVKNEDNDDCVPVPSGTNTNTETNVNTTPTPINVNTGQTDTSEQPATASDMVNVIMSLKDDPDKQFSLKPAVDASTEGATKAEIQTVKDEIKSINSYSSSDNESVELPASTEKMINVMKEIVTERVGKDLEKWEIEAEAAEAAGNVKDKKDKETYKQLEKQEEGILQQISDNKDALEVMQMQMVEYANNDQPWASTMWRGNKKYGTESKVDYMKQANGDPYEALVNVSQAISAQYKLLEKLEDKLRSKKEEKRSLLDLPPKPDLEKELKKVEVFWYKTKG